MTVGDALFRWARIEPEAVHDADLRSLKKMSEVVGSIGRLPDRLGVGAEMRRSGATVALEEFNDVVYSPSLVGYAASELVRKYQLNKVVVSLFDAQGAETRVCADENDDELMMVNGLRAVVHDPTDGIPARFERLTFVVQELYDRSVQLSSVANVLPITGLASDVLSELIPSVDISDLLPGALAVLSYANIAAQTGRLLLTRDNDGILKLGSLVSGGVVGHVGHGVASAVTIAVLGATGSWALILAPLAAGYAGRVAAKSLIRQARMKIFCRRELTALEDAVRGHCKATSDCLEANMRLADRQMDEFRALHASATGTTKDVIELWLERLAELREFRSLHVKRLGRASVTPVTLDPQGADHVIAAQESLLISARVGLHPMNVTSTTQAVVSASQALRRRMAVAVI